MKWHSIYVGPTTVTLRQLIARRAEFYLSAEHDDVLALFADRAGFIVHPSTLVEKFGWPKYRAIRVLEELAEVFQLPTATVSSPHGEAVIYVWGRVIESNAWNVQPVSYSPVITTSTTPVPVPASLPAPAPMATSSRPKTDVDDAARRALDGTKMTKLEAARGMVSHCVTTYGTSPDEAADILIELSRAGRGTTRAALAQRMAEPVADVSRETTPEDMVTVGNSNRRIELMSIREERPELTPACAVVDAILDTKNVPVSVRSVERMHHAVYDVTGEFTEAEAYAAVARVVAVGRPLDADWIARGVVAERRALVGA